jgi:hypothetical protein
LLISGHLTHLQPDYPAVLESVFEFQGWSLFDREEDDRGRGGEWSAEVDTDWTGGRGAFSSHAFLHCLSKSTNLSFPHTRRGLVPPTNGNRVLPKFHGRTKTGHMHYTSASGSDFKEGVILRNLG